MLNLDDFCFGLNIEEITSFSHLYPSLPPSLSLLSQRLQCNIRFILYIITSRFHAFVYCVSAAAATVRFMLGGGLSMDWLGVFVLWMYRSWVACVCAWVYCVKIVSIVDPLSHHSCARIIIIISWLCEWLLLLFLLVLLSISSHPRARHTLSSLLLPLRSLSCVSINDFSPFCSRRYLSSCHTSYVRNSYIFSQ